jgi:septum formation protein
MTPLILASASAVRARLLQDAQVAFEIMPARIDEGALKQSLLAEGTEPRAIADALAELKALRISAAHPSRLVLGADQILVLDKELVSKCENLKEAEDLLRRLRSRSHTLISALVLARGGTAIWRHIGQATLAMRDFSDDFLDDYLAREGEALLSGVGCYKLEGRGIQLFTRIDGDYFTILGLPLLPLLSVLREQAVIGA